MPPIAPTFIPLDWRQIAGAYQVVAEKERARAAKLYERLAARCTEMTRPDC